MFMYSQLYLFFKIIANWHVNRLVKRKEFEMGSSHLLYLCCIAVIFTQKAIATDFYSFEVTDIEGNQFSLEKYRGKVS